MRGGLFAALGALLLIVNGHGLGCAVLVLRQGQQPDVVADLGLAEQPLETVIAKLEAEMLREARALRFEQAASLRDRIEELRSR